MKTPVQVHHGCARGFEEVSLLTIGVSHFPLLIAPRSSMEPEDVLALLHEGRLKALISTRST